MNVALIGGGDCDYDIMRGFLEREKETGKRVVIACDKGAIHCREAGVFPDVIIGDLDSVSSELVSGFKERGAEVIVYPRDKNETDMELGMSLALERKAKDIVVFGSIGGRLDQSVANVGLLLMAAKRKTAARLVSSGGQAWCVIGKRVFDAERGRAFSILPMYGDAIVTVSGAQYTLDRELLAFPNTRGVSNVALGSFVVETDGRAVLVVFPDGENDFSI